MPPPTGYDRAHVQPGSRGDCVIGVGVSNTGNRVRAFLVDLQYASDPVIGNYTQIARFDHNERVGDSHNIREEGLHLDVEQRVGPKIRFWPTDSAMPDNLGIVINSCVQYLYDNADYFVEIYGGSRRPQNVPPWEIRQER